MAPSFKTLAGALLSLSALTLTAVAQQMPAGAHPRVRVVKKVDAAVTARVPGTHPRIVDNAVIGARVAASTRLGQLHVVLSASDEQLAALSALNDQQQDKSSPNFHKWLTPDAYAQSFGAAPADVAKVTAWLQDQGFTIKSVAKGNRIITFSGNVGQVEKAFQTEMHHVTVNGVAHISNTTDVAIPQALSTVVSGVTRLNDFFPKADLQSGGVAQFQRPTADKPGGVVTPLYGAATGTHYVAPGDVATIYNATPLTAAGIDGTGVSIAILAQSNINLADVEQFRSMFGLPKNDPVITVVGTDPGENGDDGEAYLDAEWSGAVATGAKVNFIVSSVSLEDGGVDSSGLYVVDNNVGDIVSLSYGGCELLNGAAVTNFYNTLWEQAAAQGQTVFVSSGDSSSDTCASSSATYATSGYGVNALGSSAYNVAVGGSAFVDYGQATYWGSNGTTVPFTNALSYIPEAPWNNSKLSTTYLNSGATGTTTGSGIAGTGGGISIYTARPNWQTGSGISPTTDPGCVSGTCIAAGSPISGPHRLVPDIVNISANNHDGALYCADSICAITASNSLYNAGIVGGTSVATPVSAGLQALINQKNGGRQGNANYYYYPLANAQYTASITACQATLGTAAAPTVTLPAATCNFHDIVGGSNVVPTSSTDTTGIGFKAGVGFEPASGLGSFNVANVANNWASVTFTATTTTLSLTPAAGVNHGAAQTINVSVAPSTGTGTPTGDFALIAQTTTPDGPFEYTLSGGSFSGLVSSGNGGTTTGVYGLPALANALPAGSYNVYARYEGDTTFGASVSNSVPVVIGKEGTSLASASYTIAPSTSYNVTNTSTYSYGDAVYLDTFVTPASNAGVPTGTVTYSLARNGATVGSFTNGLDPHGNTYFYAGRSNPNFYLKANYGALSPGVYVTTTTYSGDANYSTSTNTISFTVNALTPVVTFTAPVSLAPGGTAVFGYTIANPTSVAYPNTTVVATGTVSFFSGAVLLGNCTLSGGTCTLSTTGLTMPGTNTVTAIYPGDTNYAAASNSASVSVASSPVPTVTVSSTGTLTVGATTALVATLSPVGPTGTVNFFNNGILLGSASVSATSGVASLSLAGSLPAGALPITAYYGGSTSYGSATGSGTITIAKNSPTLTMSVPAASTYSQNVGVDVNFTRSPSTNPTVIVPTGAVTVLDNGTAVGTGTLLYSPSARYIASINIPTLTAGTHSLTVSYAGDSNFNPATAGPFPVTVAQLKPTLTLTAPQIAYNKGASVVLTATIPLSSALAAPVGMVTFYDGSNPLGSVTATYSAAAGGYVASLTTSALLAGSHVLSAVLATDTNYASTTGTLNLIINTNNVWVANSNGTTSALSNTGAAVTPSGISGGGTAVAIDNSGYIWALSKAGNSVTKISNAGATVGTYTGSGNIVAPSALAIDGAGIVWIANGASSLTGVTATGTTISANPYSTGFSNPVSINVDASGNLWVANSADNSITEVIGIATPVLTPQTTAVKNAAPAAKP